MDIQVMVVDDHELIREIVSSILETQPGMRVVYKARNGYDALNFLKDNKVDIILLDILMPYMNGLEALKQIKQMKYKTKVIMLSASEDKTIILSALNSGADGYLSKDVTSSKITEAVAEVYKGNSYIYPPVSQMITRDFDYVKNQIEENTKINKLTKREHEIMELIAQGMSNIQIAQNLEISDKTVKNHVSSILKKLNLNDRTQVAVFALSKRNH